VTDPHSRPEWYVVEEIPDRRAYSTLRTAVGWSGMREEEAQGTVSASLFGCTARMYSPPGMKSEDRSAANGRMSVVGMARVIGDGIYYNTLVDVIVHPEAQGIGIGTALVHCIRKKAREYRLKRLILYCDDMTTAEWYHSRFGWQMQNRYVLIAF